MNDTPRCNALESSVPDGFDYRAWIALASQLERELNALRASQAEAGQPWTRDYKTLYEELIYAVASKNPGETRHQTTLRYIRQRENMTANPAQTSDFNPSRDTGTAAVDAARGRSGGSEQT